VLDPPYDDGASVYANNARLSSQVRAWAKEHGANERFRIALCGYEGEHDELEALGWDVVAWKANGGYGSQAQGAARANSSRERIWFSPGCLRSSQLAMF
jgi:DNA adenine methylase